MYNIGWNTASSSNWLCGFLALSRRGDEFLYRTSKPDYFAKLITLDCTAQQAATTGDVRGVLYAASSVNLALCLLVLSYVAAAVSRVQFEEDSFLHAAGELWPLLLIFGGARSSLG